MSWITLSLVALACKAIQTLSIRYSTVHGRSYQSIMIAIFSTVAISSFIVALATHSELSVTGLPLLAIFSSALIGSFCGGICEIKSINLAPNAGYALAIVNGYVIVTAVFSFFLFNDPLSAKELIGILLIMGACTLVIYERNTKKSSQSLTWAFLGTACIFFYGAGILLSRYAFNNGVASSVYLAYASATIVGVLVLQMSITRTSPSTLKLDVRELLFLGIASIAYNLALFQAFKIAPNVGYVAAIAAGSAALVAIGSIFLFRDHFSIHKFIGVAIITCGIVLLVV